MLVVVVLMLMVVVPSTGGGGHIDPVHGLGKLWPWSLAGVTIDCSGVVMAALWSIGIKKKLAKKLTIVNFWPTHHTLKYNGDMRR